MNSAFRDPIPEHVASQILAILRERIPQGARLSEIGRECLKKFGTSSAWMYRFATKHGIRSSHSKAAVGGSLTEVREFWRQVNGAHKKKFKERRRITPKLPFYQTRCATPATLPKHRAAIEQDWWSKRPLHLERMRQLAQEFDRAMQQVTKKTGRPRKSFTVGRLHPETKRAA